MRKVAHGIDQRSVQKAPDPHSPEAGGRRMPDSMLAEQDGTAASPGVHQSHSEAEQFYQDLNIAQTDFGYGMCDFLDEWAIDAQHHDSQSLTFAPPQQPALSDNHVLIETSPVDLTQRDIRLSRSERRTSRLPAASRSLHRPNAEREQTGRGIVRRDQGEVQDEDFYPVLEHLLPTLRTIMSDSLSFALLKAYFEIVTLRGSPKISLVPCSVLDKQSFLTRRNPRKTSKVLLASMLWLSAQEADIPLLESNVAKRKDIRRRLLRLTTSLLKPLSEVAFVGYVGEMHSQYFDECMAYVHLAMVTSASAFKRASLRWWNMAFSLAREINLHLPADSTGDTPPVSPTLSPASGMEGMPSDGDSERLAERNEAGNERQRAWWFLYTMDRHISLLFNKPLSLLDSECSNLDRIPGEIQEDADLDCNLSAASPTGPSYLCTGPHFFQFFTPLSSLLGEIVYFTQARHHPRFGTSPVTFEDWDKWYAAIETRLDDFHRSLRVLRPDLLETNNSDHLQTELHTANHASSYPREVANAYGEFFLHVLHVLLAGRWDPLAVLDQDEALFASTQYQNVLRHALSSADALQKAMELDPGLQFMAFYLGIYLFQASLPFLCVADRLGAKTDEQTIKACKTLIHGLEVSTSQTSCEYQVGSGQVVR